MKKKLTKKNKKEESKSLLEGAESLDLPEEEGEPEELMYSEVVREGFHEGEEDDENVIEKARLF